jgi:hypothetical protein
MDGNPVLVVVGDIVDLIFGHADKTMWAWVMRSYRVSA